MLYLYGASGHAKVILEIAEQNGHVIGGLIDANPAITSLMGHSVTSTLPPDDYAGNVYFISIGDNAIRKRLATSPELVGKFFEILVHPQSLVSPSVDLGQGTVVMAGAVINADTHIGAHCIINSLSSVDHDCVLEDYVHVAPGAHLAGGVTVGEGTIIGVGASVIPGIRIGRDCKIGAGAVIIRDVPDGATVVGNPGAVLKIG